MDAIEVDQQCANVERSSRRESAPACDEALTLAFKFLGKRWSGVILGTLATSASGFGDLKRSLGVSDSVLSERLTELQCCGLIIRSVESGPPVSVAYRLSPAGTALIPALDALSSWAAQNLFEIAQIL